MEQDAEDSKLQFIFNGSLINKHFETIMDILSNAFKNEKQIRKNKKIIINLLSETFSGITEEKLANSFNFIANTLGEYLHRDTIEEMSKSFNGFSSYILHIHKEFTDHGYTCLLMCYFWLTESI